LRGVRRDFHAAEVKRNNVLRQVSHQGLSRAAERGRSNVMRTLIVAIALALITSAHAEPLPQPKTPGPGGSCPYGYFTSGSYCVPSQGAQDAVGAKWHVPFGWTSSGSFCLRSGRCNIYIRSMPSDETSIRLVAEQGLVKQLGYEIVEEEE
jgi:hypothetical protein